MPDDPLVWIGIAVLVGGIVLYALIKGRVVKFNVGKIGLEFERNERAAERSGISVGSGLRIKGSKTGDIAGVKVEGKEASPLDVPGNVEVARDARIDQSEVGDIAAVKRGDRGSDR